jgi:hypothetical protein
MAAESFQEFKLQGVNQTVQELGPGAKWKLDRATRVFHSFRNDRAEVILVNNDREKPYKVYMLLVYQPHRETGVGQWHVDTCSQYGERIVAESIL